jgi:hypothetical protein
LGLVSPAARREELKLRFFRHLCTAEPERALSKVFRHRCEQVKEGGAKGSLCAEYRDLLIIIISKVNTAYRGPRWGSA